MNVYGVDLIPEGDRVVIDYARDGSFEPESVKFWKGALFRGAVAIDVGAYTGLYAIMAAQAGAFVEAYEPNPVVFTRLEANCRRNRVDVDCFPVAISDKNESRELWTKHDMTSAGRFKQREGAVARMVNCIPLLKSVQVHAIKIDVEGAEMAVLRGAARILEQWRPMVIAEALTPAKMETITNHMKQYGYDWTVADRRNLVFIHPRG